MIGRRTRPALGAALLAALGVLAAAPPASTRAADPGPSEVVAALASDFLGHRKLYETPDDPSALAATEDLLDRVSAVPSWAVSGQALVDREILLVRLARTRRRGLELAAGRPSRLVSGWPPAAGSAAERRWVRRLDLVGGSLDLLADEVAAARSDVVATIESTRSPLARAALARLDAALAAHGQEVAREAGLTHAERDHLRNLRTLAGYTGTLEQLVARAEIESHICGEAMERVALAAGVGSAAALIDRLKEEGAREDTLEVAKEEAARSAHFARERGIVTIPDGVFENLVVEIGGAGSRTPFGHYIPVGWRGPQGHYIVTNPVGDDPDAVSRRRESHRFWLRGIAAHEGVPGHHLHFSVAARSPDELRHLPLEGATTEGWGLFVEGALAREGYFDDSPESRLTPLRLRRWRALRVILDLGLQTGRLTREQAIARLQRDVGFDRSVASDEVERSVQRPGYNSGYLLGAMAMERLERAALDRGGREGGRRLRDRILSLGPAAPLEAVERLALDERVPCEVP